MPDSPPAAPSKPSDEAADSPGAATADASPALGPPTLVESWRRSASLAWLILLAVAALALAMRWPAIERAFDARRWFR